MLLKKNTGEGFSLIELLVAISIILILLAMSVDGFRIFSIRSGNETSPREILRALEEAHSRTMSADGDTQYGVHFEPTSVTVFPGDAYLAGDVANTVYTLTQAEITDISLTNGANEVVFSRLRGTASATGTVTVTQTRDISQSRTIEVFATGLAEIK